MPTSNRARKNWILIFWVTILAGTVGFLYSVFRISTGLMPMSLMELENSTRTGAFLGLCLASFIIFVVNSPRGAPIRRFGFLKGWLIFDAIATLIIVAAMMVQRLVFALILGDFERFTEYFTDTLVADVLFAFIFFMIVTFFIQLRRVLGEGTMWTIVSGRYHKPRKENRIYMFLDIKNSTSIAATLGDERAHALITEVLFDADRHVAEHLGEVLSYNGDELVATWREQTGLKESHCVQCYVDIVAALKRKASHYQKNYGVVPEFWAGLHIGEVVVGECGDTKVSIVHIGDTPNTAARLEHHAKEVGRDCLISGALLSQIDLPGHLTAEPLAETTLRGHDHTTEIFALHPQT